MEPAKGKIVGVVPLTLLIIFLLLHLNFRRLTETTIVMLSVPFSLVGGVRLMWLLDYNLSVAVAVEFIALAGVATETGVAMLIYLEHSWEAVKAKRAAESVTAAVADLYEAVMEGAVEWVRPKMMTVVAIMAGPAADHVEQRHGLEGHAAHRGADGGRDDFLDDPNPCRDSRDLRPGQGIRHC